MVVTNILDDQVYNYVSSCQSMAKRQPSIRKFIEQLNTNPKYFEKLIKSPDPASFLEDEAGITIADNQKAELKKVLEDMRNLRGAKLSFTTAEGGGVTIHIHPMG
jgi:hypothetical protein